MFMYVHTDGGERPTQAAVVGTHHSEKIKYQNRLENKIPDVARMILVPPGKIRKVNCVLW